MCRYKFENDPNSCRIPSELSNSNKLLSPLAVPSSRSTNIVYEITTRQNIFQTFLTLFNECVLRGGINASNRHKNTDQSKRNTAGEIHLLGIELKQSTTHSRTLTYAMHSTTKKKRNETTAPSIRH